MRKEQRMAVVKVRRLAHALGAEITGVDLRQPLDGAAEAEVRRAWLENLVIVFPGQELTPAQQIAFGRRFGELDDHKSVPFYRHPEHP
jgi:taurine dioxygenase